MRRNGFEDSCNGSIQTRFMPMENQETTFNAIAIPQGGGGGQKNLVDADQTSWKLKHLLHRESFNA